MGRGTACGSPAAPEAQAAEGVSWAGRSDPALFLGEIPTQLPVSPAPEELTVEFAAMHTTAGARFVSKMRRKRERFTL